MLGLFSRKPLLWIILAAFFLRAGVGVSVQYQLEHHWNRDFVIPGDADGYWELATRLANGEEYAAHSPPRYVMRTPGFPAVLAVSIQISRWLAPWADSLLVARMLLAGIGTAACWLVYRLGKELVAESTGLIAAGLAAVSPVMVGFSVLILSETLFALGMLLSLLLMAWTVRINQSPSRRAARGSAALLTGLGVVAAFYVRPTWLLIGPAFVILLVLLSEHRRQALVSGLIVLAGMVAALAPWTYRNYVVTGHFVPTTLWVGPSLYDGLNPEADGESDMTFFDRDAVLERMSEYEMNRYYLRKAVDYAVHHPGHALELAWKKLGRYWSPWPNAAQFRDWKLQLLVAGFFLPVMAFALCGAWVLRHDRWCLILTMGPILYFAAVHAVFVGSLRYRLPAEYPLLILSAVGLQSLFARGVLIARRNDQEGRA